MTSLIPFHFQKGFSKANVHMEWDKIWAINRKVIDPIAPRYTALQKNERVLVNIAGVSEKCQEAVLNPKVLRDPSTSIKVFLLLVNFSWFKLDLTKTSYNMVDWKAWISVEH